jgi:surface antigen
MRFAKWTLRGAALAALMALTAPASAQTQAASGVSGTSGGLGSLTGIAVGGEGTDEATLAKRREIEEAYKKASRSTPATAPAVNDPWANMRGAEEPKAAAKPAARTAQKKKPH